MIVWIAILVIVVAFLAWWLLSQHRWWRRDADKEQVVGLLILVLVVGAIGVAGAMVWADALGAGTRALICLIPTLVALFCASKHWSRRSLRWTGLVALTLVSLVVLDVGRAELDPVIQATEELDAAASTLDALESNSTSISAGDATEREEAAAALAAAIEVVEADSPDLADRAASLLGALDDTTEVKAALARFEAAYRPTLASVAEADLASAVTLAVAAAESEAADPQAVRDAINAARCLARSQDEDPIDLVSDAECREVSPGDTLAVALAQVRLELAIYREALLGRDQDATAVDALEAALAEAQANAGDADDEGTNLVAALQAGGQAIVADLPWQQDDFPVLLEAAGWILLTVLVLAFWRLIERRSGQQMAGPVKPNLQGAEPAPAVSADKAKAEAGMDTKPVTQAAALAQPVSGGDLKPGAGASQPAAASTTAVQTAVFRIALLQNLPEPAAAPGADVLSPITDLAELAGGTANLLTRIVAAIRTVITRPGGYSVSGEVVAPAVEKGRWRVLARINDEATGDQVAVNTVKGETATMACRAAGYWAAASILSRSSRIPGWARWESANASSLAAYSDADKLSGLEDALHWDPTSGLLLCELGSRFDLEERWVDALVMYSRAVAVHPRYPVARYRMAVSLGMIGADADKWIAAPLSERERITGQIGRACRRLELDTTNLGVDGGLQDLPAANKDQAQTRLRALSLRLLDRLRDDTRRPQVLARALRRSERVIWWPYVTSILSRHGLAARDEWLIRSARLLAYPPAPERPGDLDKVETRAKDPKSWWQLSYNLACFYARKQQQAMALTWLETALERPGNQQMGGDWVTEDPDLKSLEGLPRFSWIVAQLSQKTEGSARG